MGQIRSRPFSRGFTLVELMVVVAIIAFVTAAVVPSISLSLLKGRQREAAVMIVQAVYAARSRAARTGRCHRVLIETSTFGKDGGSGGSVAVEEAVECEDDADCGNGTCDTDIFACQDADVAVNVRECSRARNNVVWRVLSFKSVGGEDAHAGLVGADVAIESVNLRTGPATCTTPYAVPNPGWMYFEPTGGLDDAQERYFAISTTPAIVAQYVRVSAGGSVKYTLCR